MCYKPMSTASLFCGFAGVLHTTIWIFSVIAYQSQPLRWKTAKYKQKVVVEIDFFVPMKSNLNRNAPQVPHVVHTNTLFLKNHIPLPRISFFFSLFVIIPKYFLFAHRSQTKKSNTEVKKEDGKRTCLNSCLG